MTKSKKLVLMLASIVALSVGGLWMMAWFSKAPDDLGVEDGRLTECPDSPNCVSTQTGKASHRMPAIGFTGDAAGARERLKRAIASLPRSEIVEETADYIRVEFTTAIMRFVDDAEFLIDAGTQQIHFRSASRIGYSDLGANKKRMAAVREAFEADAPVR